MSPLILDSYQQSPPSRRKSRARAFSVTAAKYEDIRRLVDIEFFAFENEKTNHILSYRDYNQPGHFERAIRSYQSAMSKADDLRWKKKSISRRRSASRPNTDYVRFRKVTDAHSGEIISWAKTEVKTYTAEDLASPADIGHEGEDIMNRDWFALNEKLRRDYMGSSTHCCKLLDQTSTANN